MHHPWPTHSLISSKTKLNASAPNFYHLILLIRFFFHLPRLPSWSILFQPRSLKFTNSFLLLKINNVYLIPFQLSFWNSASMNFVQSSQILSISLFLKEFFHRHLNKLLSSLFSKNHLYPLMISTTFVQSLTSTSFPKFSKKLLPPAFNLTCLLTLCLLLFNLLTWSSIQLKLLFSKFTMTSSLRWIVVRSLHSFFLTYLLLSTLSIIPSFSLVFKIGLVLMVFLLLGSHPISHLALRQSQSMIPSLHSLLFPVVYPKVPYLAHFFLLSILLLFARWSQKIPSNIICMLMTPSCTSLSLLQILLYLLTHLPPLSMTFSPGWIWTNYSLIHQKLNFFSLAQNNNVSNFLILLTYLSAMIFIPVSSSARNLGFIFDSDMSFSDQIKSVSKSCHFHIRDIRRIRHLLPLSAATALANSLVSSKLDYCNSLYSGISQVNLNKLQRIQNSLARVITNTSKYQHITPILKKLHWLPIKQRINYKLCLLTYKTLTNQQPTYLYNSLSFPSHSVSTRSSDSLVLSIPYVRSSLGKRAFSVIGPRLWEFTPSWYPKLVFFTNIPFPAQNTPLQNCFPSLGSFPSPWTVYPDFDSCYSHFMPYRMTPSVRHRAIEVYYYYYYYYY